MFTLYGTLRQRFSRLVVLNSLILAYKVQLEYRNFKAANSVRIQRFNLCLVLFLLRA